MELWRKLTGKPKEREQQRYWTREMIAERAKEVGKRFLFEEDLYKLDGDRYGNPRSTSSPTIYYSRFEGDYQLTRDLMTGNGGVPIFSMEEFTTGVGEGRFNPAWEDRVREIVESREKGGKNGVILIPGATLMWWRRDRAALLDNSVMER